MLDDTTENSAELLKHADVAMYRAKNDGRNQFRFYSETLHARVQYSTSLKRDLHKAVLNGELVLHYQPQFNAIDASLSGMEALVRWNHPVLGMLGPGEFIGIAEETGLIIEIGNWVLQEACRQLREWNSRFPTPSSRLTIAVNLSAIQLVHHTLVNEIDMLLAQYQLSAQQLELEITENALIDDQKAAVLNLEQLAARNVRLTLDDFGTGYSSMHHLKLFRINVLKIDREFVAVIGESEEADRLLIAIIRFAQAMNLKIVAEGVETQQQASFCRLHGCEVLQGYYYSRPLSAADVEAIFLCRPQAALMGDAVGDTF